MNSRRACGRRTRTWSRWRSDTSATLRRRERWSKPWIQCNSRWLRLLTSRRWKTSWQRRRGKSSTWSMTMRRAGPDMTRRRNSSSRHGTTWGWRCIRKCLASGSVPLTRPCPSSPSRGSPPTPGEAWHDTIQDKTSRRENKRAERKYREYNVIYTGLHLDTLYLFMPFTGSLHLREYFSCCYCPLLALNGTRKFIFSVGPRRREGYNCELTPRNRSRSRRSRAWKEAVSPFKVTFFISSSASCTLPCLCKVCFKSFFFFFCLCVLYNRMECELVLLRLLFRCDRREMSY